MTTEEIENMVPEKASDEAVALAAGWKKIKNHFENPKEPEKRYVFVPAFTSNHVAAFQLIDLIPTGCGFVLERDDNEWRATSWRDDHEIFSVAPTASLAIARFFLAWKHTEGANP